MALALDKLSMPQRSVRRLSREQEMNGISSCLTKIEHVHAVTTRTGIDLAAGVPLILS